MRQVTEYRAKDGTLTYRVRYRSGGEQHSKTFRRKNDATLFANFLESGGPVEALGWLASKNTHSDAPTFGEFFEHYVNDLTGVTLRTRDDYRAQRRRYLTELDPMPLPLITRSHVTGIVNRLEREGKSPKTIKNVVHMLSSCLALAMDEGHIARNPCRRVNLPKDKLGRHQERFLTHEEFGALYDATPAHYQPLVSFLVGTGLRWSEATAIQGRHIDLAAGTVRVEQAWKRIPGGWELGPPKSAKGWRTVNAATLALYAVEPLIGKPRETVFKTQLGKVVRHANFYNRIWVPAIKKADLADDNPPSPHSLRHTHASWLISDGTPLEAVQDQLGHESILTTRAIYGHLLPAVGVAAGRSASAGLERALANRMQPGPIELSGSAGRTVGEPD